LLIKPFSFYQACRVAVPEILSAILEELAKIERERTHVGEEREKEKEGDNENENEREKEKEKGKEKEKENEKTDEGDENFSLDVNARDKLGHTALHCIEGSIECAQLLLQLPSIELDVLDGQGQTPLHVAALKGYLRTVEALLERGADPNGRFDPKLNASTPLTLACLQQHVRIVETLLKHGADYQLQGSPPGEPFSQSLLTSYPLAIACEVKYSHQAIYLFSLLFIHLFYFRKRVLICLKHSLLRDRTLPWNLLSG